MYEGSESKHLIRRLKYLVEYNAKYGCTESELNEIKSIENIIEKRDPINYLQNREKELHLLRDYLGDGGSMMQIETRAKHLEILIVMKELKVDIDLIEKINREK